MNRSTAVIIGVGLQQGLGAALARGFAKEGYHVFAGGRSMDKLQRVVDDITALGGLATAMELDATDGVAIADAVRRAEAAGKLELAIYNAGNNVRGEFLTLEPGVFELCWSNACLGAVHLAHAALPIFAERGSGTLIFTGASASLRGMAGFAPFAIAKAGLRALAQSLAREFGPKGVHVAHVVVDGAIDGDRIRKNRPEVLVERGTARMIDLEALAEAYLFLHRQKPRGWTHELDLRTYAEPF